MLLVESPLPLAASTGKQPRPTCSLASARGQVKASCLISRSSPPCLPDSVAPLLPGSFKSPRSAPSPSPALLLSTTKSSWATAILCLCPFHAARTSWRQLIYSHFCSLHPCFCIYLGNIRRQNEPPPACCVLHIIFHICPVTSLYEHLSDLSHLPTRPAVSNNELQYHVQRLPYAAQRCRALPQAWRPQTRYFSRDFGSGWRRCEPGPPPIHHVSSLRRIINLPYAGYEATARFFYSGQPVNVAAPELVRSVQG